MKTYKKFINESVKFELRSIGIFHITSGDVIISDPCYEKGIWCQGVLHNVMKGEWKAYLLESDNDDDIRVAELIVVKKEYDMKDIDTWIESNFPIGVDSGQCGIFDKSLYPNGETGEYGYNDTFYGKCCNITELDGGGVLEFGVVSSSGYGDGGYTCFYATVPGEKKINKEDPYGEEVWEDNLPILAIKMVYIDENDDE